MKLQTIIPLAKANNQIDYNSQLLMLGSCFVENIGDKFSYFKFQSVQNPFGILFNPKAIETLVTRAIYENTYTSEDVFYLNERWQCYDAHSNLSANSKEELLNNLNTALEVTLQQIKKASHILITLGTAWVYRFKTTKALVANCHKVPQKEFTKELLSGATIQESLNSIVTLIQSINPDAQFVFTVSPVRHIKDGFVENQHSKAHLLTAIHQIVKQEAISYFPSYEIMMDELRDYRFYADDMVHPNSIAVNYIWEKFKNVWINPLVLDVINEVDIIQKSIAHRPFNAVSEQHQKFLKKLGVKITRIQKVYPFMKFEA
ncbi:GSCFA domain-containing protein [Cellulophaga baltica]|uniref:GSCFA domain-containing protein n=1 Tax=Cellulophaga TaxID=104264 RepID=UPI001C072EE2|nr:MULTISPECIES: GSCFA domain-containing protein [Cellulophaga]MBU2995357.1 GSCFA domain-containing protein [Cellulophaga baltica]MDO6766751.1 GSCFA domain-containing protein [Cellulophaga sp. 1_MG-2023]